MMLAKVCQTSILPHMEKGATVPDLESFTPFIEKPKPTPEQVLAKLEGIIG